MFLQVKELAIIEHIGGLIENDDADPNFGTGKLSAIPEDGDRMETLRNMENVLITPHRAFYTENAVSEMIYNSLLSCRLTEDGEKNPWEIV